MAWKFYKKFEPKNQPVLSNNSRVVFDTIDQLIGWFGTQNEMIQREFAAFMGQSRYGITEVSEKEFHEEYVQKKTLAPPLKPLWREEITGTRHTGNNPLQTLGPGAVAAAVAVRPVEGVTAAPPPPATVEAPKQEFRVPVGRRTPKVMPRPK